MKQQVSKSVGFKSNWKTHDRQKVTLKTTDGLSPVKDTVVDETAWSRMIESGRKCGSSKIGCMTS